MKSGMCPGCGVIFSPCGELIPWHDKGSTKPAKALGSCIGSGNYPRNPDSDKRPLWRDNQ